MGLLHNDLDLLTKNGGLEGAITQCKIVCVLSHNSNDFDEDAIVDKTDRNDFYNLS